MTDALEELRHVVLVRPHAVAVLAAERLSEHGVHLAGGLMNKKKNKKTKPQRYEQQRAHTCAGRCCKTTVKLGGRLLPTHLNLRARNSTK